MFRRGLAVETILIQREAPVMLSKDRQKFVKSLGNSFENAFSAAKREGSGAELALFSRLNRQGLLEQIEKRQAQLAALPGEQQEVAGLRSLTQQLSSLSLSNEEREALREQHEHVESQLYRLLPELKPRVVKVSEVAEILPVGGVLVEFQRYVPFNRTKKPEERYKEARYLALVLQKNGSIDAVDLGLADLIEHRVEKG